MSVLLTSGRRNLICQNNKGGVKDLYLMKFEPLDITQIILQGQELVSIPSQSIYKFWTNNAQFSEQVSNDESGIKYEQSLTFKLNKANFETTKQLHSIKDLFLRYVLVMNDETIRIGGLFNGASMEFTNTSGGSKTEGTNYEITMSGAEEISAPYLENLTVLTGANNFIFMDANNFTFMDSNNFIHN